MSTECPVRAIRFSNNGFLASSTSSQLRLRNMATGQDVRLLENGESCGSISRVLSGWPGSGHRRTQARSAALGHGDGESYGNLYGSARKLPGRSIFRPTGRFWRWRAGRSSRIFLWNWQNRCCLADLDGRQGDINIVAFSPDGQELLLPIRRRKSALGRCIQERGGRAARAHGAGINALVFAPDGGLLVTASYADGSVKFWDPATGQPRGCLPSVLYGVTGVAFSPDATILAVSRSERGVALEPGLSATGRLGPCDDGLAPGDRLRGGRSDSCDWRIRKARCVCGISRM